MGPHPEAQQHNVVKSCMQLRQTLSQERASGVVEVCLEFEWLFEQLDNSWEDLGPITCRLGCCEGFPEKLISFGRQSALRSGGRILNGIPDAFFAPWSRLQWNKRPQHHSKVLVTASQWKPQAQGWPLLLSLSRGRQRFRLDVPS